MKYEILSALWAESVKAGKGRKDILSAILAQDFFFADLGRVWKYKLY